MQSYNQSFYATQRQQTSGLDLDSGADYAICFAELGD